MQNVFNQPVYTPRTYIMSPQVLKQLEDKGILADGLSAITGKTYHTEQAIIRAVKERLPALTNEQEKSILAYSEVWKIRIDPSKIKKLPENEFSPEQMKDMEALSGKTFEYRWELEDALAALNPVWSPLPDTVLNKQKNKEIAQQFQILEGTFKWVSQD